MPDHESAPAACSSSDLPVDGMDWALQPFSCAGLSPDFPTLAFAAPSVAQPGPVEYGSLFAASYAARSAVAQSTSSSVSTNSAAPSSSATTLTGSSTVPAWVGTLSTASIAADMAAADVGGTVTYSGLEKLLADLASTLMSSKTSLTSAELSDLKTISGNLNNGMSTSSYLTGIMNALVNGNPANATWTGGATASALLGNLAIGSSATQLSELIGKWFLGTDLPNSKVGHERVSQLLGFLLGFAESALRRERSEHERHQSRLSRRLLSCCRASPRWPTRTPTSSPRCSPRTGMAPTGCRFYVNGVADYVTVNNSLADGGSVFNSGTDIWGSLAEKAYAQLQAAGS